MSKNSPTKILCSPWWPFPYLLGVGRVLLLDTFRSRATSWVTPTAVISSLSCWCHVFLEHPRRLAPGIARFITLRETVLASRLWTCPNQRRRPPRITSSIGEKSKKNLCASEIECIISINYRFCVMIIFLQTINIIDTDKFVIMHNGLFVVDVWRS